ncbi:Protein PET100, mitochondrial [Sphaceloma murrayae]|uniref:Protein PET100, mitochondrial n=1 Tax=Sphaceloma murrayae TaxID=2082308 RepID=A0A2K1QHW0_9PEZI|nr:Protein PET100, mitochondrial [Sphaceloma murrayae]
MGGPNLEVFKFGMYIMFPIGIMYYFGTNLDEKFSVPEFWPKKEQTHQLPYDRKEIEEELERLKARRLAARARRLELSGQDGSSVESSDKGPSPILQSLQGNEKAPTWGSEQSQSAKGGWFSWGK